MPAEQTSRAYGGLSADERIAQRQAALREAALELADRDGWRPLSVEQVCKAAGLNKRYFYESYTDLDALAHDVVDHIARAWQAVAIGALAPGMDRPELARAVLTALVKYMAADPRRARLLFGEMQSSPAMKSHRAQAVRTITDVVVQKAGDIHHGARTDDPLARVAATMLLTGTGQVILDWLSGGLRMTQAELVEELAALWVITGDGAVDRANLRTR